MKLTIIGTNLHKKDEVEWIEFTTKSGSFVIQEGYAPSLFVLAPEKDFLYKPVAQDTQSLVVQRGILSVDRQSATLLIHTK